MGSESEEQALADAERGGDPYLSYRDGDGRLRVLPLPETWEQVTIGRGLSADVILSWDEDVSRMHAELNRLGDEWVLTDDGLSRNGSFVSGERVTGRRALRDGDVLRFGQTEVAYRAPYQPEDNTSQLTRIDLEPPEA